MKAVAVVPGKKEVRLVDHAPPVLQAPTHVMLRMLEVGVCGTDKEICSFEYGTPPNGFDYLVLGHESLGEVIEISSGVSDLKLGDLVVPTVRRPCLHDQCLPCRNDRQDFCYTGDFVERGIKEMHGYMTEFVVDDEKYMNVVPRALRDVAILVEPLTIAEKGLQQVFGIQGRLPWSCSHSKTEGPGHCHRAVVLGAGPVGILGAMALKSRGFETYCYSRSPAPNDKSRLLESIGVKYISTETTTPQELAEMVGNIDLIYEGVGLSKITFDVANVLGQNGIFVLTGIPAIKRPVEFDADHFMRNLVLKNQVVFGTVNAGKDAFEAAVGDIEIFMKRWPSAVKALITGRYSMEEHRDLLFGKAGGIKNLITIAGHG